MPANSTNRVVENVESRHVARYSYPFALIPTESGYSAGALQFPSAAAAESREELLKLLREQVALHLLECEVENRVPEEPKPLEDLYLGDYHDEGIEPEVVYIDPAPISAASLAVARAVREEAVTYAELARRMGVSRSVVNRITDPLYFGHTSRTLRKVAQALGRELHVDLVRRQA